MKVIIFDRDGTLNKRNPHGYVYRIDDLILAPDLCEAASLLINDGFYGAVASNQAGIAKQIYGMSEVINLENAFGVLSDKFIDFQYVYCPHSLKDGCDCRKPKPGMLRSIIEEFSVTAENAVFIGDSVSDLEAANSLNIHFIGVCWDREWCLRLNCAHSLFEAIKLTKLRLGAK